MRELPSTKRGKVYQYMKKAIISGGIQAKSKISRKGNRQTL